MSKQQFEKAKAVIQSLPRNGAIRPSQEDQLYLYSYYKQAGFGDNNTTKPGMMDFTGTR
ncbi:acyl-CoA-binding protein [Streptomyces sp. NPDC126514]|uniref:acyl-CoA-binding protein n=1 Tax=Streptomyces sp. NPDC126514 TaxID=3155210 RepID=UPI003327B8B7